jgi:predicted ATP-grasp superfamily ATP-dependent carboligase
LKNRPELFANYLKIFKKSTFKKVIKETCSPDLLSSIFAVVDSHLSVTDPETTLVILEGVSKIPKFDLTVSLLPADDVSNIRSALNKLGNNNANVDKIEELKHAFKLA